MTITGDQSINFGEMDPGSWKELYAESGKNCNVVKVISDTNFSWNLQMKVASELRSDSDYSVVIPNDSFLWMSTYAGHWEGGGSGTWWDLSSGLTHLPTAGYIPFSLMDELVYYSASKPSQLDNKNDPNGTEIGFKYAIRMPEDQLAGNYTTTIVYTVTQ